MQHVLHLDTAWCTHNASCATGDRQRPTETAHDPRQLTTTLDNGRRRAHSEGVTRTLGHTGSPARSGSPCPPAAAPRKAGQAADGTAAAAPGASHPPAEAPGSGNPTPAFLHLYDLGRSLIDTGRRIPTRQTLIRRGAEFAALNGLAVYEVGRDRYVSSAEVQRLHGAVAA